ncbi:ankyrin repeat domain-containing protein [Paenibacillus silviterrae]|uniref:ankyrin repeat domain-containing protein n=1 Tax=Paenibacillus silviterrae TaxID=3242194 RepID=UPI002542B688|nr:ankyrin repeat domain-containing protein [Paenibacillus chinjuensis]
MIVEFFTAVRNGETEVMKAHLDQNPALANTVNPDGLAPLGFAAHFGQTDAARLLLQYGADVNALSQSKLSYIPSNTALHAAIAGERNMVLLKLLLAHNASTTVFDSNGHTCLHSAAFHDDNVEMIRLLLDHGADVHARQEDGVTALALAEERGNLNAAAVLRQALGV